MAVAASAGTVLVPHRLLTTTNVTRCSALPYLPPRLSSSPFLKQQLSGIPSFSFSYHNIMYVWMNDKQLIFSFKLI